MKRFLPAIAINAILAAGLIVPALAAPSTAQITRGKQLFAACAACHSVKAQGPARMGPHLQGIVGRKAATVAGFRYSNALKTKNLTWTEANLDRFLQRPQAMVAGTSMAYAGLANAADRKALIAYLKQPAQ